MDFTLEIRRGFSWMDGRWWPVSPFQGNYFDRCIARIRSVKLNDIFPSNKEHLLFYFSCNVILQVLTIRYSICHQTYFFNEGILGDKGFSLVTFLIVNLSVILLLVFHDVRSDWHFVCQPINEASRNFCSYTVLPRYHIIKVSHGQFENFARLILIIKWLWLAIQVIQSRAIMVSSLPSSDQISSGI